MRTLTTGMVLGLACLLASPLVAEARGAHGTIDPARSARPPPVALSVSIGYGNIYRGSAWTPVRTTLHNRTDSDMSGTLDIPENGQAASLGTSPTFHGLYSTPVQLPAGATKHVTMYMPGAGVQGQITATFKVGARTLGAQTAYALGIDTGSVLIGVMARSPADYGWIANAIGQHVTAHVVRLTVETLDAMPDALATFDIIALTNADTSQLDGEQIDALQQYAHNGGSLILVGGPYWQETLRPLGRALVPGSVIGTRTLQSTTGLAALMEHSGNTRVPEATVSVLRRSTGSVLASQSGIPLVVKRKEGRGGIEYLGFDPSLAPLQSWAMRTGVLEHVLILAAPLAVTRTWSPQGFRPRARKAFGALATTSELANAPPVQLPLFLILALLTLLYVLFMGPINFLVLRRLGRQSLAWVTVPALSLVYFGSMVGLTTHLKYSSVMLNSVGIVTLDGRAGADAATFYLGLTPPMSGTYSVVYGAKALPATIPQFNHFSGFFWRNAGTLTPSPVGMLLGEGAQTSLAYLNMKRWDTRDTSLTTSVHIPGAIHSDLHVDARGDVVGTIRNSTNLTLLDPVVVSGQTASRLGQLNAGGTVQLRVQPTADTSAGDEGNQGVWSDLYGGSSFGGDGPFGGFGRCCDTSSFDPEKTLLDRVRNAAAMLTQVQDMASLGQTVLIGWTDHPFGSYAVNGSTPARRDLTMVAVPLNLHLPSHGPFRFRAGTWAPQLVDLVPRAPGSNCCNFFSRASQRVAIGAGGSLTFAFDLPLTARVQFSRVSISLNVDNGGTSPASVYDWHAGRWVALDLSLGGAALHNPNRFVSSTGRVLLRLDATGGSGDISIDDPSQSVQISGGGVAQ